MAERILLVVLRVFSSLRRDLPRYALGGLKGLLRRYA